MCCCTNKGIIAISHQNSLQRAAAEETFPGELVAVEKKYSTDDTYLITMPCNFYKLISFHSHSILNLF